MRTVKGNLLLVLAVALELGSASSRAQPLSMSEYSCAENSDFCCFDAQEWPKANGKRFRCEKGPDGSYPCVVRLGRNNWVGSSMNVHLAAIFLEEFLGYPVQIVDEMEHPSVEDPSNGQWPHLAKGEIDAILEIWPSGHSEYFFQYVIEQSEVVDAGSLGVAGNIGWFMPSLTLSHPDLTPSIEYWRTFQDQDYVQAFESPHSQIPCCSSDIKLMNSSRLPCMPTEALQGTPLSNGGFSNASECDKEPDMMVPTYGGRFLAGAPDWSQVDGQIIRNLGLNMTVEYAVTEENLIREFEKAVKSNHPLVFYFWKPHALFRIFNLTRVMLPPHTTKCWDKAASGGVDCDYPIESLYKVYSKAFGDEKPDAALFLSAFRYTSTEEQEELLAENYLNPDKPHREVACRWAREHRTTWERWTSAVTKQFQDKTWQREKLQANYTACECSPDGRRNVFEVFGSSRYEKVGQVDIKVPSADDICAGTKGETLYETRWTLETLPIRKVNTNIYCAYVHEDSPASVAIIVVTVIGDVILFSLAMGIVALRESQAIKAARLWTMLIFLLGAGLLNTATVTLIGDVTLFKCYARVFLMVFGFTFFAGSLLVKQTILKSLMCVKYKMDKKDAQKRTVLLRYQFAVLTLIAAFLWGLWALVAEAGFGGILTEENVDTNYNISQQVCEPNTGLLLLYVFLGFLVLVISCILAQQTKDFSGAIFSEAKFMFFSNYNAAIFFTFALALSILDVSATTQGIFVVVCIFFATIVTAILIAGSRIYAGFYNLKGLETGSMSSMRKLSSKRMSNPVKNNEEQNNASAKPLTESGRHDLQIL